MRTPFQEERDIDTARLRAQIADGFRFLWRHPFLRTVALIFSVSNFAFTGVMLSVIVIGEGQGLTSGRVGLLIAAFGGCAMLGAFASGVFRRYLSMRAILLSELWAGVGLAAFVVWPNVYVLTASLLPQTLLMPVTDTVLSRLSLRGDARSLDRARHERQPQHRLCDRSARIARGRLPARRRLGARSDCGVRRVLARPRALGNAEPFDPAGTESPRDHRGLSRARHRHSPLPGVNAPRAPFAIWIGTVTVPRL